MSSQGDDGHQSVPPSTDILPAPVEQTQDMGVPTQPIPAHAPAQHVPVCMYVGDCATGSQLRKAISHLFGRNKLCTKAIPTHIWVHLCRKHYQRTRYRDVNGYAFRQVGLVLDQIQRVQDWSDDNVRNNRRGDGVLRHWTLQARKREARRLQNASRKRPIDLDEEDDDDTSPGNAIPIWLQDRLNQQYSTPRMRGIIEDIQSRMINEEIKQIPDIEILPEIARDMDRARNTKAKPKAPRNGAGHGYSKSDMSFSQDPKRTRTGASPFDMQNMRQSLSPQENNAFTTYPQSQANTSSWSHVLFGNGNNNDNLPQVLPIPVPQRNISPSLNGGGQQAFPAQGRTPHARSMSDNTRLYASGLHRRRRASQQQRDMLLDYTLPTGFDHGQVNQIYGANANGNSYAGNTSGPSAAAFTPVTGGPPDLSPPRNNHARLQSTPSFRQMPMGYQTHMQQQQQQATIQQQHPSMNGGPQSLNSMPTMGNNNNIARRVIPSYPSYTTYPNTRNTGVIHHPGPYNSQYPFQNLGQQSANQGNNGVPSRYPQQPTAYNGGSGIDYFKQPGPRY
ncbi:hypothetical protein VMCG_09105 [Cytospora schulzeri]|uniref:ORP1 like protein n=1 Tax=Cytospora schulzeri TaxID=448051 RepID=A0A423VMZ5_9PEZI|nr:hypothetical protein VMCG_09105 [Valsa malicola]